MPKKPSRTGKKTGRPPGRKPTYLVFARIDPALGAAFEAFIASTKPKATATAALSLLLEEALSPRGFWPPPSARP